MSTTSRLLPLQPMSMTTAQLAAVSFLARYAGHTHELYSYQLRRWFLWCEGNGLDPLVGIQRAHVELYIRGLGEAGALGVLDQHDDARGPRVLPVRSLARWRPAPAGFLPVS
jgi:hypothetical protein